MRCQAVIVSAILSLLACPQLSAAQAETYEPYVCSDAQGTSAQTRPLTAGVKMDKHLPSEDAHNEVPPYGEPVLTELPYVPGYTGINTTYPAQNLRPLYPMEARQGQLPGELSDNDLQTLGLFDVVIMQDRSGSMSEKEFFPPGIKMPRWQWCLSQASDLTRQTQNLPQWGATVVLFSNDYDVYRNVTFAQIPFVFRREGLHIGTRMAKPLEEQFADYFRRRSLGQARPLVVAIISDGKPQDDDNLCDVIVRTTQYMQYPGEIRVVFLQVGTESEGQKKLQKFDNELVARGARFDIVSVVPFLQLSQMGLSRSLIQVMRGGAPRR